MSFFQLDVNKCRRDGVCSSVCVAGIIKNDENKLPYIDEKSSSRCIACGLCVAFCPHDACTVEKLDKAQFVGMDKELKISNASAVQFLKSRRSIRKFKNKALDDNDINTIMDTVRYSPSAKNSQQVRWVFVKGFDKMKMLADFVADFIETSSKDDHGEIITTKLLARAHRTGKDVFFRGAPNLAIAIIPSGYNWREDGAISLTYLELAAYGIGAGACWAGYFTSAVRGYKPLRDELGLNDDDFVAGAQMLGYPIYRQRTIPSRKKLDIKIIE